MSRVGKQPITLPSGVNVTIDDASISVSGPKGNLTQFSMPGIAVNQDGESLTVSRSSDEPQTRAKHGLMRALLHNMVEGVSRGFERKLEINGVGYRVQVQGDQLKLALGLSHEVVYKIPEGVSISVEQNIISVAGANKQIVGQVAAEIRALKKPEPYKGKGIKYADERIIRKSGKSGKEAAA